MPDHPQPGERGAVRFPRRAALSVTLGLALIVLTVATWPRDAVPSFRTACDTCASLGGGSASAPNHPVFADSGTARFMERVQPVAFWLWVAVSPAGYLAFRGVRWLANRLHATRR